MGAIEIEGKNLYKAVSVTDFPPKHILIVHLILSFITITSHLAIAKLLPLTFNCKTFQILQYARL